MTKPELICHLITAVLGEWTRIQTETRNGGARGGELGGALPRQEGIHRHHGIPARTRTRRKCLLAGLEKITALNTFATSEECQIERNRIAFEMAAAYPNDHDLLLHVD